MHKEHHDRLRESLTELVNIYPRTGDEYERAINRAIQALECENPVIQDYEHWVKTFVGACTCKRAYLAGHRNGLITASQLPIVCSDPATHMAIGALIDGTLEPKDVSP